MGGMNVVVTGGASGIGEAVVRSLVSRGDSALIADVQEEQGRALAAALGARCAFHFTDVTTDDAMQQAVAEAEKRFGPLTGLVNSAGVVGAVGSIFDTPIEHFDRSMAILSRGVFLGIQAAARAMRAHGAGSIVSLASTAGVVGGLGPHVYTMAKHGVVGLTRSAAAELSRHGIRVNAVAPGGTVTPMTAALADGDSGQVALNIAAGSALGFAPNAQDMANAVLFALGDESRYMTGHTLVVDAGQTVGTFWENPFYAAAPAFI